MLSYGPATAGSGSSNSNSARILFTFANPPHVQSRVRHIKIAGTATTHQFACRDYYGIIRGSRSIARRCGSSLFKSSPTKGEIDDDNGVCGATDDADGRGAGLFH